MKIEKVRKRDGDVVAYDEARIADDISKAAQSVGIDDRFLATDLANVVTLYLERYHGQEVPESRDIQEMVEKVLVETGHPAIARAYIHIRDEGGRASLEAADALGDLFPADRLSVEASTRDEASAWDRRRIAGALVKEAGLEPETAEGIAAVVEGKIFRAGGQRVTTSTIRQLVDHELFVRGLNGKLQRQSVVGVPKYDLDRLVQAGASAAPGAVDPARVCEVVGETALRQYALQDLFEADVASAHIDGALHLSNLEHPLKLAWLAPSIEYLKRHGLHLAVPGLPEVADGPRTLTGQLRAVVAAAPRCAADAVEIIHAETFYAPFVAGLGPRELECEAADLASVLAGPSGLAAGVQPTLHLHVPRALRRLRATGPNATSLESRYEDLADAALGLTRSLLASLRSAPPRPPGGPRPAAGTVAVALDGQAFRDPARAGVLRDACLLAAGAGNVLFLLDRDEDFSWPASRLGRFGPDGDGAAAPEAAWFSVAQAVFINLPQVAFRGEAGDLAGFHDRLDGVVALAVQAHQQKHRFLRRFYGEAETFGQQAGWAQDGRGALRLSACVYLVVPLGLNEAVRHLAGRELAEGEEAVKIGIRILSYLYFRVREEARRAGIRIEFGEYPPGESLERLSRIDARKYGAARDAGVGEVRSYTASFHCRTGVSLALSDRLAIESRFHTLVQSGRVEVTFPPGVARSAHDIHSLLQRAYSETKAAQVHIV